MEGLPARSPNGRGLGTRREQRGMRSKPAVARISPRPHETWRVTGVAAAPRCLDHETIGHGIPSDPRSYTPSGMRPDGQLDTGFKKGRAPAVHREARPGAKVLQRIRASDRCASRKHGTGNRVPRSRTQRHPEDEEEGCILVLVRGDAP